MFTEVQGGQWTCCRCLHVVVLDEQVVHITDSVAQVGRRPLGGGTYLAAWESHHHLDTVP